MVQGASLQPFFAVGAAYSPTGNSAEGATTPEFYATTGEYTVVKSPLEDLAEPVGNRILHPLLGYGVVDFHDMFTPH